MPKTHKCDICEQQKERPEIITVRELFTCKHIGQICIDCLDVYLKFGKQFYDQIYSELSTEKTFYQAIIEFVREVTELEKINRNGVQE